MYLKDWRARLFSGLAFFVISSVHEHFYSGVFKNTPEKMLVYHATAAMADLAIVQLSRYTLSGRVKTDIQHLNLCAIVVNLLGWLAYLAYAPPVTYNITIVALAYVQFIRLLWADGNASNTVGMSLVRRNHFFRSQRYFRKATL